MIETNNFSEDKEMMTWKNEFDESYNVPASLSSDDRLRDVSWHNDGCPSFMPKTASEFDAFPRLFVEHEDPAMREFGGDRFIVVNHAGETLIETNDLEDAVGALLSL